MDAASLQACRLPLEGSGPGVGSRACGPVSDGRASAARGDPWPAHAAVGTRAGGGLWPHRACWRPQADQVRS